MTRYSIEPNSRKEIIWMHMDYCHSREIYLTNSESNYWILLLKRDKMLQKI